MANMARKRASPRKGVQSGRIYTSHQFFLCDGGEGHFCEKEKCFFLIQGIPFLIKFYYRKRLNGGTVPPFKIQPSV